MKFKECFNSFYILIFVLFCFLFFSSTWFYPLKEIAYFWNIIHNSNYQLHQKKPLKYPFLLSLFFVRQLPVSKHLFIHSLVPDLLPTPIQIENQHNHHQHPTTTTTKKPSDLSDFSCLYRLLSFSPTLIKPKVF